jgi:phage shock protein A
MDSQDRLERRESHAQIARLEVQVETLEREMSEMRADVKEILAQFSEAKGSWKTLLAVAGLAGTLGAFASKIAQFFIK